MDLGMVGESKNLNMDPGMVEGRDLIESYLVINELGPETSQGSMVRIRRQDGVVFPCVIDVLNNHKGLGYGLFIVNKHWNHFINWVILEEQITLVVQIIFQIFVFNSLQFESNLHPVQKWASNNPQKDHLFLT